jgi:hypothetical protein
MEKAKADSKIFLHREYDRRLESTSIQFPLLDSNFNIIRKDRYSLTDRRKLNLKLFGKKTDQYVVLVLLRWDMQSKSIFFIHN